MEFQDAFNRIANRIQDFYGIGVEIADVVDPNTGDFDGTRILLDYDQDLEIALFVLVHLFGHTVQWNTSAELRELGLDSASGKGEQELPAIQDYERDASRYGLALMHESGVTDMDRWLSGWCDADWQYLRHFYLTGERLDARSLLKPDAAEVLTPLAIPEFTPQRWTSRWSF